MKRLKERLSQMKSRNDRERERGQEKENALDERGGESPELRSRRESQR